MGVGAKPPPDLAISKHKTMKLGKDMLMTHLSFRFNDVIIILMCPDS